LYGSSEGYCDRALQIEQNLVRNLKALPPETHAEILHSVFKQDEWMLIVVGGALGAVVGALQNYMLKYLLK
jgi:hypothetical protein